MVNQAGKDADTWRHGDESALVAEICAVRDELHRMAAEVAEDIATLQRHDDLVDRMWNLSGRLRRRSRRLTIQRGAPEL